MPGQDSNHYDDSPEPAAAPDGGGDDAGKSPESDDAKTSILPKSFFGGDVKPGQTCTVRVTQCHENDCEVEYVGDDDESMESHGAAAPKGDSEMSSMME